MQLWMLMQVVYIKLFFCVLVLYAFIQGVPMSRIRMIVYTRIAWVLCCLFNSLGIPEPPVVEQAMLGSTLLSFIDLTYYFFELLTPRTYRQT